MNNRKKSVGASQIGGELSYTSRNDYAKANSRPRSAKAPSPLTTDHCSSSAVGPSALPCAGGLPPQRPPDTMPRWRRVAGLLSMPPVAHPRRAAKPSAVTTVGAGLVPAHSRPKIGLHPKRPTSWRRNLPQPERGRKSSRRLPFCRQGVWGIEFALAAALDAVAVSPAGVARAKDSHVLTVKPALREGRVVYEGS